MAAKKRLQALPIESIQNLTQKELQDKIKNMSKLQHEEYNGSSEEKAN